VLLSDIRMPGQSGLELLQEVKTRFPSVPVIIMTAYSDLESAVAAFQGAPLNICQSHSMSIRRLN
jgi:two-component system nitrogen regulation response regulator GlnG